MLSSQTRFTLVAILFGVILCNRFVDNRFIDFLTPYAAAVKNSDAQKVAFLESLSNVNFMSEQLPDNRNDLTLTYQKNYPYQQVNKPINYLEKKYDDTDLYLNKVFNDKNESNQENDNGLNSR